MLKICINHWVSKSTFDYDSLIILNKAGSFFLHIKTAGINNPLFTEEAINEIFQFTGGIPRKINNICEKCLLDGYIQEKKLIDDILVKRVIKTECE